MKFHNPYHFVPVSKKDRREDLNREDLKRRQSGPVTHARYVENTRSGRIVCRLTTETPVVVGGCRDAPDGQAAISHPFEIPSEPNGQAAIPASSLRGLISSLAEAASNSALRVLGNRPLSYRKEMEKGLSAIGLVAAAREPNKPTRYYLRPLTLPMLPVTNNIVRPHGGWRKLFPRYALLKVFVGRRDTITDPAAFPYRTAKWTGSGFDRYYGVRMPSKPRPWKRDGTLTLNPPHHKQDRKGRMLLSQLPDGQEDPIEWDRIPSAKRASYCKGVMRVLGAWGGRQIVNTKKHEIFIPYTPEVEAQPLVEIPPKVVERFHALADERTIESNRKNDGKHLPYEPRDTRRSLDPNPGRSDPPNRFRLKTGDLVFFDADECGVITEISLSSIWRGSADGTVDDFFAAVDPELIPACPKRAKITPAEAVFGFVDDMDRATEQQRRDKVDKVKALALAGRVRFSHALFAGLRQEDGDLDREDSPYLVGPDERDLVTLKILNNPKPPSPALYFKPRNQPNGGYVAKACLSKEIHDPQGRKMYLHHKDEQIRSQCWKTAARHPDPDAKMKTRVRPLKPRAVFHFHVDFQNLTDAELGMVLYALTPSGQFRHKLGMGKAIGLGRVRIETCGVFCVNRQARYSTDEALFGPRYHEAWLSSEARIQQWAGSYPREAACQATGLDLDRIRSAFVPDPNARYAIELIGDPSKLTQKVHTPLLDSQAGNPERETYRWFVKNDHKDNRARQFLVPIRRDGGLEPLDGRELPPAGGKPRQHGRGPGQGRGGRGGGT